MQADEDVGKIALAVPVLVCESCFLSQTSVVDIICTFWLNYFWSYNYSEISGIVLARPL